MLLFRDPDCGPQSKSVIVLNWHDISKTCFSFEETTVNRVRKLKDNDSILIRLLLYLMMIYRHPVNGLEWE
jgi:hypothetical protein